MPIGLGANVVLQPWTVRLEQAATNRFIWHCIQVSGLGAEDQAALDQLGDLLSNAYKALLGSTADFRGWTLQRYQAGNVYPFVTDVRNAGLGTGGLGIAPPQVAGLISWRTPLAGRKNRGRSYLPYVADADMDPDGTPAAVYLTKLETFANLMLPPLTVGTPPDTSTIKFSIANSPHAFQPVGVSDWRIENGFATQRRRGYWGRPNSSPL